MFIDLFYISLSFFMNFNHFWSMFPYFYTFLVLRVVEEGIIDLKLGLNLPIFDLISKFNTGLSHVLINPPARKHSAESCISPLFLSPLSLENTPFPLDTHHGKIPDSIMIHRNLGD